ncbi:C4-type zinc ribbon domain-containing protein [Bdellovibrionota bacterium FG-2]
MANPLALREQLKALESLQELDIRIDRIKKDRGALPGVLKSLDDSLAKVQTSLTVKKAVLGELEKTQRQTQGALDMNRERVIRSNTKLEAVANSTEYQAVNKEIEQLKKLETTLGEQTTKTQAEMAVVEKDVANLTAQFEKIKQERDAQAAVVTGQATQLESQIAELMTERAQHVSKVERPLLSQYERIRTGRAGIGISPAIGGRCKACNIMLPPQLFNEIQKGLAMHSCPSCLRILFVPVSTPAETAISGS